MIQHWILDDEGRPRRADVMEWAEWWEVFENRIQFETFVDHVRVSTIFLGIDHSFGGPIPILWETMALGDGIDDPPQERCGGSREQAEEMHRRVVAEVRAAMGIPEPN